jgi:hypothetical protein
MGKRDILVVFDIDETLLQYINKPAYKYWEEASPEHKRMIENNLDYIDLGPSKRQIVFLRPGLKQFLDMARDNGRIKVAIWTYSEQEYAKDIAKLICEKYNLPADTFIFKYGAEDIEDDDMPKSMQQIWDNPKFGKKFNKFNTFIVDDRYGNLCHNINRYNSILVQAFAPFGETKQREALTDHLLEKAINDDIFRELSGISEKLLEDIDGCEDEEIEEAFKTEAVFAPKCMKRKGLDSYVKEYAKGVQLCTLGEVENAASAIKGGRRRRTMRRRKNISARARHGPARHGKNKTTHARRVKKRRGTVKRGRMTKKRRY